MEGERKFNKDANINNTFLKANYCYFYYIFLLIISLH